MSTAACLSLALFFHMPSQSHGYQMRACSARVIHMVAEDYEVRARHRRGANWDVYSHEFGGGGWVLTERLALGAKGQWAVTWTKPTPTFEHEIIRENLTYLRAIDNRATTGRVDWLPVCPDNSLPALDRIHEGHWESYLCGVMNGIVGQYPTREAALQAWYRAVARMRNR